MSALRNIRDAFKSMSAKDRFLVSYIAATSGYGIARKTIQLYDAKLTITDYDDNYKKTKRRVPVLMADKLFITTISTIASPYFWPVYLYNDMKALEVYARGLSSKDYDIKQEPSCVSAYMF